MTLPGGPADKLGNRYEKWWTLSAFVRMLQGHAEAIRIEDPGADKAEFVVTTDTRRELHQVKRSHPNGKWSLAALRADGLLDAIGRQLAGNENRFVFASTSDARDLADLCEAARDAQSPEELKEAFLKAGARNPHFASLLKDWKSDEHAAFDYLRRIEVHVIDERQLEEKVTWGIQASFLANPKEVADALRGIAEDSVHRTITRGGLVDRLSQRGYTLRRLTSPASARGAVDAATDRFLDGARRKLILKQLVPRQVTQTLLSRLDDTATESVMTGRAGSGKTACVVEVVDALRKRDVPVLAFRLDHLVSASTTADLGRLIDLEESPILVLAAAARAAGRPGVLIVDQLDAVSTVSGRTSAAFDRVEQLLLEARGSRAPVAIHVVVVCREFDWENDPRMRRLLPESHAQADVTEFSGDEVKKILTDAGFETPAFKDRQLRVLRLPQNLSLFLDAGFDSSRTPTFQTAKEIFDRYWDAKRRVIEERFPNGGDHWLPVMKTLCKEMTSTQQLSVRKETLDTFSPHCVNQLASEGVISFDGRRYGFGHESFFDYVFARLFVTHSESLVELLKASEQHLFRRGQVRQVLAYLRDAHPDRYVDELRGLLSDDGIRTHLKDLVFTLLADVTNPTDDEWAIWKKWLEPELTAIESGTPNEDKLSTLAWRRFFASRAWFAEIDRREVVERWLASNNDRLANMATNYLRFHQRHSPDRVAALLEPYADRRGEWQLRLRSLMESAEHHTSRRFFDLFLRLMDNGVLDQARGETEDSESVSDRFYTLRESRSEWVPEALARILRRRFAVVRDAGGNLLHTRLVGHNHAAVEAFLGSATNAPAAFIRHLLPVVLEIADSATINNSFPKRDAVWPGLWKSELLSGEDACLLGLARALAGLARDRAPALDGVVPALRRRDTHVANHLLLAVYSSDAQRYGDEAVRLLCDEQWRFQSALFHYDDGCAAAVVRAAVPHCPVETRERLEELILRYVSPYEQSANGYKQHGQARLGLLSAFPKELLSGRATRHLAELIRKFGEPALESPRTKDTLVKSPIDEAAAERMTDDEWLGAIAKYASEHRIVCSDDGPTGGVWELGSVLEARVKEEPERFARLSLRFPADANPVYLERTLRALKNAAVASELKLQVFRKAFAEATGSLRRSIPDMLGSVEDPLPDDMVGMLDWLATQDNDPAWELCREDAGGGQARYGRDILTAGINTTRGRAAWAIRDLVLQDAAYVARFRGTLERMVRDPSVTVRSCVAGTLRAVAFRDPALGMSLFLNMNLSEERLLATHDVDRFIHSNLRDRFAELRPFVERMVRSSAPEVRQAGGRLAGIAALLHGSAADLAAEALRSDAHGRRGVAEVASANVAEPEFRSWCEARLIAFFDDVDAEVRSKAAWCFRHLPDETLDQYGDLIAAFCDSRAFDGASFALMNALEHSRGRLPGTTCAVCEKFCEHLAGTSHAVGREHIVAKLVFRTYQQHPHDEWTARALDLIDRLCLDGIPTTADELEQFER